MKISKEIKDKIKEKTLKSIKKKDETGKLTQPDNMNIYIFDEEIPAEKEIVFGPKDKHKIKFNQFVINLNVRRMRV